MNREVELILSGLHTAAENAESGQQTDSVHRENDSVETVQPAQYFKKNDSHYVLYEEKMEGLDVPCKSRIKFRDNILELTRHGSVEMQMIFEENKRHVLPYNTPYGQLFLGIETGKVQVEEREDEIHVTVEYKLDHEGELLSESCMKIHIRER